jgi:2'-5' RNA ligase
MKKSVNGISQFDIQLKGLGVFPNIKYIKVIWIGIENGEYIKKIIQNLNNYLIYLGFEKEKKIFSPHLTIARVKNAKNKEKISHIINKYRDIEFRKVKIESIKLKRSQLTPKGPIYSNIREIRLRENI